MTKAAIYARPSAPGETKEAQLSKLRALAEQRGLTVVASYSDNALGSDGKRLGLVQLLKESRTRKFDVLMVDSFDRIAWSVLHVRELLGELGENGIRVISVRDRFDSGASLSDQSVLTASIIHILEKRLAHERVQNGLSNAQEAVASKSQAYRRGQTLNDVEPF